VMSVNFQFNRGFALERGGCGLNNAKGTGVWESSLRTVGMFSQS
jgi:hypothetical protein